MARDDIERLRLEYEDRRSRREWVLRLAQLVLSFVLGLGAGGGGALAIWGNPEQVPVAASRVAADLPAPAPQPKLLASEPPRPTADTSEPAEAAEGLLLAPDTGSP